MQRFATVHSSSVSCISAPTFPDNGVIVGEDADNAGPAFRHAVEPSMGSVLAIWVQHSQTGPCSWPVVSGTVHQGAALGVLLRPGVGDAFHYPSAASDARGANVRAWKMMALVPKPAERTLGFV
jgi:hypothetical protein